MKKICCFICVISIFMLGISVLAMPGNIPTVSTTTVVIDTGYDKLTGIIQWLGYLLDIMLIIITIISTIAMIKKKKSIGKIILFDLIMIAVIWLLGYGVTSLGAM